MFTHVVVGTNDLERARRFYDKALAPLAVTRMMDLDSASLWGQAAPGFMVTRPLDGQSAAPGNGITVSFAAPSRASIRAFYEAALASGGTCGGAPGPRHQVPNAYAAYVRDPDGNKICAFNFDGED
jgi:catechol 2,3-dioxygenase-like lactoylglutathione lyase family enzyme